MRNLPSALALLVASLAGLVALVLTEVTSGDATAPAISRTPKPRPDPIPPSESARVELACGPRRSETAAEPERVTRAPRTRIQASPTPSAGEDKVARPVVTRSAITVQLVSAVHGTPIAHTPVRIGHHGRGETDAAGRLTFDGRGYRATRLCLEGYPAVRIELPGSGKTGETDIPVYRIAPPGVLQGTVLGALGETPDGAQVRASLIQPILDRDREKPRYVGKFLATVDGAGGFRLEGVPVRTPFRVQVTARNAPAKWLADSYRIEPGIVTTLHVRLAPCGVVRGRVLDQYGRGVPAATVRFVGSGHPSPGSSSPATTDASGEFVLRGVPIGSGRIRASPEFRERHTRLGFPWAFVPIHLRTHGELAWAVIRVHCGRIVQGRVVGPDGRGIEGAWVWAPGGWRPTDENGDFRIGPFRTEKVKIRAIGPDRASAAPEVEVDSDARGVVLRLVKLARIAGRVLADGGLACGTVFASARGRTGTEFVPIKTDGRFEFKRLEPGSYDLWAVAVDGRVGGQEGVLVDKGGTIEDVRIRVDETCAVEVRLTGPGVKTKLRTAHVWCDVYRDGRYLFQTGLEPPRMKTFVPPGPIELDLVLVGGGGLEGLADLRRSAVLRPGETLRIDWPVPEESSGKKRIDLRSRFSRIRRNARW